MVPILVLPLTFDLYSVYLLISKSDSSLVTRHGIGIDADQWLSYQFKTEAVRPFKYLLFDLLHVTAERILLSIHNRSPSTIETLYLQLKGPRNGDFLRLGSLTVI